MKPKEIQIVELDKLLSDGLIRLCRLYKAAAPEEEFRDAARTIAHICNLASVAAAAESDHAAHRACADFIRAERAKRLALDQETGVWLDELAARIENREIDKIRIPLLPGPETVN